MSVLKQHEAAQQVSVKRVAGSLRRPSLIAGIALFLMILFSIYGFMAKIFGVLLMIAGLGYLTDGFGAVLVPDLAIGVAQFVFVGEAALIFWLLINGRRTTPGSIVRNRPSSGGVGPRGPGTPDA